MILNDNLQFFDYISFDIFDTLIKRCVYNPHEVFELVERYCLKNNIFVAKGFREKRIVAERTVNTKKGFPSNLIEIYNEYCEKYGGDPKQLSSVEKRMELIVCKPNVEIVRLFKECLRLNKKVYIISDMYLDSDFLREMLFNCGIYGFEKLYVSCECGCTKTKGELFKVVSKDANIDYSKWLHVGDNPKGDIKAPSTLGIHTFQVIYKESVLPSFKANICNKLDFNIVNRFIEIIGMEFQRTEYLGAKVLGPILAGFSKWLYDNLSKHNITRVYFLSRDGYVMKEAFEKFNEGKIQTSYIYASRRSWTVPAIWLNPEYKSVLNNISMSPKTSVRSFLTRIGLISEEYISEVEKCGLSLDSTIAKTDLYESHSFRKLYDLVKEDVISNSKTEYSAIVKYFKSEKMQGRFVIVDIGYNGTLQKALQDILDNEGIEAEIYGYYIGLNSLARLIVRNNIQATSYLYGPDIKNDYQNNINAFISVFESIFLAQHGSVYRFVESGNEVIPELYDYEYELQNDRYVDEIEAIKGFQKGALTFVDSISEILHENVISVDENIAINNLLIMGLTPDRYAADLFGDFRMFDTRVFHIAHPDRLRYYILNPQNFKKDFSHSTWKIAFLYRLFRLPLPYEKIYCSLKKWFR